MAVCCLPEACLTPKGNLALKRANHPADSSSALVKACFNDFNSLVENFASGLAVSGRPDCSPLKSCRLVSVAPSQEGG